jgi:hypothetical protein
MNDMLQAAAAAGLLDDPPLDDAYRRRALETAISVCYARPWIDSNKSGKLRKKWLPEADDDRTRHRRLLDLRHKTNAHTDPDGGRQAIAQFAHNVLGLGEEWIPLPVSEAAAIVNLCETQAWRFRQAIIDAVDPP